MEEWSELDEKLRAIEQDEQRAALLEELQALPEKYQQVLALCYLEGKTRRAIADDLGCSLETVKGRLARGRQVLRHRLIRRGVSLSLAMAAMTVPVKSAAAAVTPSLIGLTVTGATAWAAGALGAAKVAGAAGTTKAVTTASTQVIHLAHQGTVAMTIASFAKPAVIAVALLGAVSGTLAVDSNDGSPGDDNAQTLDLATGAEGEAIASEDITIDGEGPVVTVAASEEAKLGDAQKVEKKNRSWTVPDFVVEKRRVPAPPRSPQPVKVRTMQAAPADVLIPAVPPIPEGPVTAPLNVRVPKLDLKLHLKLAQLESRVSQLQLESKKLEIAAFGAEGEEKEKLIEASREKLLEAEAEKLQVQIEQQKEQIKALEAALKEQAKELGKQAAKMAMDADIEAELAAKIEREAEVDVRVEASKTAAKAKEAAAYATARAKEAAAHAAKAATLKFQDRALFVDPASGATIGASPEGAWVAPGNDQEGALSLKPGDRIQIEIIHFDREHEYKESSVYTVEPMGTVALGANYGRAEVKGLSVIEAEDVIADVIKHVTKAAKVQVTFEGRPQPRILYAPAPVVSTDAEENDSSASPKSDSEPSESKEPK